MSMTKTRGTTVVITTHYIEEAKLANKVNQTKLSWILFNFCWFVYTTIITVLQIGLLRCGQLLSEVSPNQLLAKFQCESLEEAFLNLSQRQKENQDRGITTLETFPDVEEIVVPPTTESSAQSVSRSFCFNTSGLSKTPEKKYITIISEHRSKREAVMGARVEITAEQSEKFRWKKV